MRSLRHVLGRGESVDLAAAPPKSPRPSSWNTLSTLGAGAVADVDRAGIIFPRNRPLSIELWFGTGDRWIRGAVDGSPRQTRIAGLPIVETRQRIDDNDVVQTAWADESGDRHGRVVIRLVNEGDVAVVAAVVVRPQTLLTAGSISEVRVAGALIVADRLPVVDLGRVPGDVAVSVDSDHGETLLHLLEAGGDRLIGDGELVEANGKASIAAMIPLTPGVDRILQVLDGREVSTVAPAPLERVVAGWKTHLGESTEFELPSWPKHLPASLASSLLGAAADTTGPLGDLRWHRADDAAIAVALHGVGLDWAAASVVAGLLDAVADGQIKQSDWTSIGVACSAIVGSADGNETLRRHGDVVVPIVGELLTNASTSTLDPRLVECVRVAHGQAAANDAASIVGRSAQPELQLEMARLGVTLGSDEVSCIVEALDRADRPLSARDLGLLMVQTAQTEVHSDALVPVRARAGTTWRWGNDGCGDSPHARASLLIGLRSLCVRETPGVVDLLPGMVPAWLGQNVRVTNLPTGAGRCSFAIRWHGERPALLWEFADADDDRIDDTTLCCTALDPTFHSADRSGEALLAAPTHLVDR